MVSRIGINGFGRIGRQVLRAAIEKSGYKPGIECFIGLDVAATELYESGKYILKREDRELDSIAMLNTMVN